MYLEDNPKDYADNIGITISQDDIAILFADRNRC